MLRNLAALILTVAVVAAATARASAQHDLPPDVQFDVLRLELANAAHDGRHKDVLSLAEKMRKLGRTIPPETSFLEAKSLQAVGALTMARHELAAYLKAVGRKGAHYDEALHMYVAVRGEIRDKARKGAAGKRLRAAWGAAYAVWQADRERAATWKKRAVVFGGPGEDSAAGLAQGPDGGLIVAGAFYLTKDKDGTPVNRTLPWITAFDAKGCRVWHRPLGGVVDAGSLRSAAHVSGRGYVFGGVQKGFKIVAMTDGAGNVLTNGDGNPWIIGFAPAPHGEEGIGSVLPNGKLLALGVEELAKGKEKAVRGVRLPVAVWLAPDGKVERKSVLGRTGDTLWYDVKDAVVLGDGSVVIVGETRRKDAAAGSAEGYMMRVGPDGREMWLCRITARDGGGIAITAVAASGKNGILAAGRDGECLCVARRGQGWQCTVAQAGCLS